MDVEGDEWHAIPAMLESGVIHSVKQIAIELHFGNDKTQLAILRRLYEAGFRIVMRDRNILNLYVHPAYKQKITNLYELTLLRWKE